MAHRINCPDDGACHHHCEDLGCWRVFNAEPLSEAEFPKNMWPKQIKKEEHERSAEVFAKERAKARAHMEEMTACLDMMEKAIYHGIGD
jgi:hypothetical protein